MDRKEVIQEIKQVLKGSYDNPEVAVYQKLQSMGVLDLSKDHEDGKLGKAMSDLIKELDS